MTMRGSDLLCRTLEREGVDCVFGMPGTQTVGLYESLRRSRLRTILATSELAASFMVNGYWRASGRPGVLVTIPGPGFTYALPGIAEAFLDSAAVLWIVPAPAVAPGKAFQLQSIDQQAIAGKIVKAIYRVDDVRDLRASVRRALAATRQGEPGPVLLEVSGTALAATISSSDHGEANVPVERDAPIADTLAALQQASRVALLVGAGALDAALETRQLAELLGAPVITTTSARGVLPENHPLLARPDLGLGSAATLNALIERSDLVLALGWKGSHNGTSGFRLRIPAGRLIHVDASSRVLGANYDARLCVECDVPAFIRALLRHASDLSRRASAWADGEVAKCRAMPRTRSSNVEPVIAGGPTTAVADLFSALRRVLPNDSHVVTDSGLHQMLTRRHFEVLAPRGLIVPTNFQSMGFGLPAAIGAKLASPDRPVVAVVGDGSLGISAMELLTALREHVSITIVLLNDASLGLIRLSQLTDYGHAHSTTLLNPDFRALACAFGVRHVAFSKERGMCDEVLRQCIERRGVTLVEVELRDSAGLARERLRARALTAVRTVAGEALTQRVKRWAGRA